MGSGTGGWLARTGVLVLALGPLPALFGALDLVAIPTLAIVAHVSMMMCGVLFMCVGLAWPSQTLSPRTQRAMVWLLLSGAYGAIATVIVAALLGVGGEALAAIPNGIIGSQETERILKLVLAATGLSVAVAIGLTLYGSLEQHGGARATLSAAGSGVPTGTRLLHVGMLFFLLAVLSAVLTGLTPVPGLGTATHVGVGISGLILMSIGLVLPEVSLSDTAERRTFWLLLAGATGTLATGGLAAVLGGGDSVVDVFFTGFIGTGLDPVQLIALAAVLSMAFGAITVWHGLPEAGTPSEGALKRPEDMTTRIIRLGVVLVVFSLVAALLSGLTRVPRVAVGTWATVLIIGPMLLCFGLLWQDEMSEDQQRTAYGFLKYGAIGILVTGMALAVLGIGGDTLGVSAAGWEGSETQELVAKVAVDLSAALIAIGLILMWRGTRAPTEASVFSRSVSIAYYVAFVLILQTAFYHVLPKVYFGDAYPVRLMDYGSGDSDVAPVTWVYDDGSYETAQNWTEDDWLWFYHAPQGGAFELPVPYDWMMALEQPTVRLWPRSEAEPLMDSEYLEGFGFLPNPVRTYDPCAVSVDLGRISRIISGDAEDPCEGGAGERVIENNPDGLPVGFTRVENWIDHATGQTIDAMGFTCAACHTSQLDFVREDSSLVHLRIEGGPANVDLGKFREAVGISLGLTSMLPRRFDRFADRLDSIRAERATGSSVSGSEVTGSSALAGGDRALSGVDRDRLRADLDALLERGSHLREVQDSLGIYPTTEGFARLDAIGRIANYVFSSDLGMEENLDVANAPVNFPHIWDAPRLAWVQYNASFRQPMMRNAGQSLGVFASVDLEGAGRAAEVEEDALLFSSSIDVLNIHEMETLLGGCTEEEARPLEPRCRGDFHGLESPVWPDAVFGPIDSVAAFGPAGAVAETSGAALYERYCSRCHGSSPHSPTDFFQDAVNWADDTLRVTLPSGESVEYTNRYVRVDVTDLWEIGTDPLAAVNFRRREAVLGELGERLGFTPPDSAANGDEAVSDSAVGGAGALAALIGLVKERRYQDLGLGTDDPRSLAWADTVALLRAEMDGYRADTIQAPLGYRARPLNGIWATPPFLHNGSVPTLYLLLSPQEERPRTFYLGSRRFDPERIGFEYGEAPGAFEFDTSLSGNSNQGHSFEGDASSVVGRRGVLGPELTHEERLALIEYLKALPPLPVRADP